MDMVHKGWIFGGFFFGKKVIKLVFPPLLDGSKLWVSLSLRVPMHTLLILSGWVGCMYKQNTYFCQANLFPPKIFWTAIFFVGWVKQVLHLCPDHYVKYRTRWVTTLWHWCSSAKSSGTKPMLELQPGTVPKQDMSPH